MTNSPSDKERATEKEESPPYPGAPRWVKVGGIVAAIVMLLFGLMHALSHGHGDHGQLGKQPPSQSGRHHPDEGGHR